MDYYRTTEGMRKAKQQGYWVGIAPFGYNNCRTPEGKPTLIPNEKANLVSKAYKLMAKGIYSADEIRKKLKKEGLTLEKNAFLNMLKNPVYCGKIFVKEWKKEDAEIVEGIHPALVSEDIFNIVKDIFSGKKKPD